MNQTSTTDAQEGVWNARPILSRLLRICIFTVPIMAAMGVTSIVRLFLPTPTHTAGRIGWWLALLTVGAVVAIAVERLARRLLPLAMLLKLSMLFPNQAPSRFRVARTTGTLGQLKAEMDSVDGSADVNDHATRILALVTKMAAHDRNTRGHSERVRVFTDLLSEEMKLSQDDRYRLRWASLLHDIGKVSVDARILNKPSKLNAREWEAIREHPNDGAALAGPLLDWLGPWGHAIAHHHERYDGGGYPANLAHEQISEAGRIVAVADAYDTMTSARSYQRPKSTALARRELVNCAGGQFDPVIVRAFLEISLPKLLWAVGPVSLLVHLPFLARMQEIGQASVAAAAQTATVTAVVGVTAIGLAGPVTALNPGHHVDRVRISAMADTLSGNSSVLAPAVDQSTESGDGSDGAADPDAGVKANDTGDGEKPVGPENGDTTGESEGDSSGDADDESDGSGDDSNGSSGTGGGHAYGHDKDHGGGSGHGQGSGSGQGQGGGSSQDHSSGSDKVKAKVHGGLDEDDSD